MSQHRSWKHFTPKAFEADWKYKDGFIKYCERIANEVGNFPPEVLEQSFYKLYNYPGFKEEFSCINYYDVSFQAVEFSLNEILQIQPPRFSKNYLYERIESMKSIDGDIKKSSYSHLTDLIAYWYERGTWKVPIIVLQSNNFTENNYHAPYQLFEGHNRLAWVQYFAKHSPIEFNIASNHKVWLMKKGGTQNDR